MLWFPTKITVTAWETAVAPLTPNSKSKPS